MIGLLFEHVRLISSFERKAFQSTKARLALAAIAVIPALYCLIFLFSIKDPYGNLERLPAAIVNLDQGIIVDGKVRIIGDELSAKLMNEKRFGFVKYKSKESACKDVREGKIFFSITIPQDFSAAAVRGKANSRAKLQFYVSQGGNYFVFRVAESAMNKIVASINESLALTRWEHVGSSLPKFKQGFIKIKEASSKISSGSDNLKAGADTVAAGARKLAGGIDKAETGSRSLADGSFELSKAIDRLTRGMMELSDGIRSLDTSVPGSKDLEPLSKGMDSLAANATLLADGLEQLYSGTLKAAEGSTQSKEGSMFLAESVKRSLFSPASLIEGTARLADGIGQLDQGIHTLSTKLGEASKGGTALSNGASQLKTGIDTLLTGILKIKVALDTMAAALAAPEDLKKLANGAMQLAERCHELSMGLSKIRTGSDELAEGASAVADGAAQLTDGVNELNSRIPGSFNMEIGDPAGMATSVVIEQETTAAVADNATAFAPYFIAISLWLGCIVMTFVFPFRSIPNTLRSSSQPARVFAKLIRPGILAFAQAAIVTLCLWAMGIQFDHPLWLFTSALLSGWTFLVIVFMFFSLLGDAGRLLCIILLVLQIGASGGSFPVEVSPTFFRIIHDWLPMTYAIAGFRSSISSAFEGHLGESLSALASFAVAALILLRFVSAKWKYVPDEEYKMVADY
jgi:putative membrane protein